jgi:hypothetical protein
MNENRRTEYMKLSEIRGADRNPKTHEVALINQSMTRFGVAELPLLDERTGKLVAGHGRLKALREMHEKGEPAPKDVTVVDGEWLVPVQRGWASKDDAAAEAYLIASNNLTTKGGWDTLELSDMLRELEKSEELAGVGFDSKDIDALLTTPTVRVGEPDAFKEWEDMPEFENPSDAFRKIIVTFADQEGVDSFAELIGQKITPKTKSINHPYKEKRDIASLSYEPDPKSIEGSDAEAK